MPPEPGWYVPRYEYIKRAYHLQQNRPRRVLKISWEEWSMEPGREEGRKGPLRKGGKEMVSSKDNFMDMAGKGR